jgi:hypothetical protein
MRCVILVAVALVAACHSRPARNSTRPADSLDFSQFAPGEPRDTTLLVPRVVSQPAVVVFWLPAADTMTPDDQAAALDDIRYYTDQVAPRLAEQGITLLPTNADTVYVTLANGRRRAIVLSGLDYPFGYLLVDPGGPERILTGVYADDELLDEIRVYFDLPDDSLPRKPRITT